MRAPVLTFLILITVFLAACVRTGSGSSSDSVLDPLGFSDDSDEAVKLVNEANSDLRKVKAFYRQNLETTSQIREALQNRDIDKIKKGADDLVYQINEGMAHGENAYTKVDKASELKVNETFKEYLRLKAESLRKWLDAFEFRRQAAMLLRDGVGDKNGDEILVFKEKEENFQKYSEIARELSQEANLLFKESLKKGT